MKEINESSSREINPDGPFFEIYDPREKYHGTWPARSDIEALSLLLFTAGYLVGYDPDKDAAVCNEHTVPTCLPVLETWRVRRLERAPEPGTRPGANELPDDFFATSFDLRMELEPGGQRWPIKLTGWLAMFGTLGEMARWPSGVGSIATAGEEFIAWGTWEGNGKNSVLKLDDGGRFTEGGRELAPSLRLVAHIAGGDGTSSKLGSNGCGEPHIPLQVAAKAFGVPPAKFIYWMGWAGYLHR